MNEIDLRLRPVGRVLSPLTDPEAAPKQGDEGAPEAWIEVEEAVREALTGVEAGAELIVLTWLDRADLVCLPSEHEIFPITFLEAWQHRTAVIGSDIASLRELMTLSQGGVTSSREPAALAATIASLLTDDETRSKLADAGCEFASTFADLGASVTILEGLPNFLAAADAEVSKVAAREFKKQGLDIKLGCKVSGTEVKKDGVHVSYTDDKGAAQEIVVDKLLVAVGRRAATKGLLADGTGVKLNERGAVVVDEFSRSSVPMR